MKLSTGKVAFPIEFDNGEKTAIYFNPQDRGIQDRIKAFEQSVEKRIKEIDIEKYKAKFNDDISVDVDLENIDSLLEKSPEELTELQNRLNAVNDIEKEYNKAVRDELDVVFNSKISDTVFKYCEPFDIVIDEDGNREMYVMIFMKWLAVEFKKYGAENQSAMDKHLKKYAK